MKGWCIETVSDICIYLFRRCALLDCTIRYYKCFSRIPFTDALYHVKPLERRNYWYWSRAAKADLNGCRRCAWNMYWFWNANLRLLINVENNGGSRRRLLFAISAILFSLSNLYIWVKLSCIVLCCQIITMELKKKICFLKLLFFTATFTIILLFSAKFNKFLFNL